MIRPLLQIVAITSLALAAMFYPFMPGGYDPLAATVSGMAQVLAASALLLVPIGVGWLLSDIASRRNTRRRERAGVAAHWFALGAAAAVCIGGLGVAAAALQAGPSLAAAVLIILALAARRAFSYAWNLQSRERAGLDPAPLYLILVPGIVATAYITSFRTAVDVSRRRTIAGSAPFIAAIEAYRATQGRYPVSLEAALHDYDPPTVGVERYRYEPHGESYNVFFEHPTWRIGTREFVMYNPRDEHVMIVHNQDLLESPSEAVERERQFHARAARDAGVPHWKYFWFD